MQTSFELPMNAALSMAHSSEVFRLEEGEVDIFAVDIDGEGRQGLRHHLFSIVAPALVLGMGLNRAGPLDVVAQSRGARLRAGAEFDVGEVDRWIGHLSEALHRRLTERGVQGLAPRPGEAGALSPQLARTHRRRVAAQCRDAWAAGRARKPGPFSRRLGRRLVSSD